LACVSFVLFHFYTPKRVAKILFTNEIVI